MIACSQAGDASCAFGLGKRKHCPSQPILMRREPLGGGLFVEEFVELNPRARRDSVAATAPLRAEDAFVLALKVIQGATRCSSRRGMHPLEWGATRWMTSELDTAGAVRMEPANR